MLLVTRSGVIIALMNMSMHSVTPIAIHTTWVGQRHIAMQRREAVSHAIRHVNKSIIVKRNNMDKETLDKAISLDSERRAMIRFRDELNSDYRFSTLDYVQHGDGTHSLLTHSSAGIKAILEKHDKEIRSEIDDLIIQTEHQLEEL